MPMLLSVSLLMKVEKLLPESDALKIVLVYYAVAAIIVLGAYISPAQGELATNTPILLSILLLIPICLWQRNYRKETKLPRVIGGKDKETVLFWIFVLFALALSVRIPSALLFGEPYEKMPLIYLLILTILVIEKTDIAAFGFKTGNLGKSLGSGMAFWAILGGLTLSIQYIMIWGFTGQVPLQSYGVTLPLLAMPFMTLCVGISEEGLFRGYMQSHLGKLYTSRQAILVQAILFGGWHFVWNLYPFDPWNMAQYVATTFLIGLVFGYFYSKTNNLVPLVLAHGLWNSVPLGIVENGTVMSHFWTFPFPHQMLVLVLPFTVSALSAVLFIKYLVRKVQPQEH